MASRSPRSAGNLDALSRTFGSVVATLGSAGADDYRDLYVSVTGTKDARAVSGVAIDRGRLVAADTGTGAPLPDWIRSGDEAEEHALLMATVCRAVPIWDWTMGDVARHLRCGPHLLDVWLTEARFGEMPRLPSSVVARLRQVVVVEQLRLLEGVPDAAVPAWLRRRRAALGRRSPLQLLTSDGDVGFARLHAWLAGRFRAPSDTIH